MRMHRHWSDADIVELRKLAASGQTAQDIAKTVSRTMSAIQSMAYKLKIKIVSPKVEVPWTEEEKAKLKEMRNAGLSYLTISKHFGRSRQSAIGVGFRMGLSLPTEKSKVTAPKLVERKAEYVAPGSVRLQIKSFNMARIPDITKYLIKGSTPKSLVERQFDECCFPVAGDSDQTLYCCEPVVRDKKYCKRHYRVMYVMRT